MRGQAMRKGIRSVVSLPVIVALVALCSVNQALADEVMSRKEDT